MTEIIYALLIYVLGINFALLVLNKDQRCLVAIAGYPIGLIISCIIYIICLSIRIDVYHYITLTYITALSIFIINFIYGSFYFNNFLYYFSCVIFFPVISFFIIYLDPTILTGDSFIFISRGSAMVSADATSLMPLAPALQEFVIRGPLAFSAQAAAGSLNTGYIALTSPLCGLATIAALGWFSYQAAREMGQLKRVALTIAALVTSICATTYIFWQYSFLLHSASAATFYILVVFLSGYLYARTLNRDFVWICAICALGSALTRIEGPIFLLSGLALIAFAEPMTRRARLTLLVPCIIGSVIWSAILVGLQPSGILGESGLGFHSYQVAANLIAIMLSAMLLLLSSIPDSSLLARGFPYFGALSIVLSGAVAALASHFYPAAINVGISSIIVNFFGGTWSDSAIFIAAMVTLSTVDWKRLDSAIGNILIVHLFIVAVIPLTFLGSTGYTWEQWTWDSSQRILLPLLPLSCFYASLWIARILEKPESSANARAFRTQTD